MPGVLSINFNAAGCHAGRQGRAAGFCKMPGAKFLLGERPKNSPRQLAAGGHLSTPGTSWGPPAALGVQLEG
eukprot:610895-Pelagomonas_calceolata.AAC.1